MSTIEERWLAIEKAVVVYGCAEADVMGVADVMPEVAVEAAGELWAAIKAGFLAVLEELPVNPQHPHDKELHAAVLRLRRRIQALG
jgi:hypothetical protein